MSKKCDALFQELQKPEEYPDVDEELKRLCQGARASPHPVLQLSVFGLMEPADIKAFLCSSDNRFYHEILGKTENFLTYLHDKDMATAPVWRVQEMTPDALNSRLRSLKPVVMDQTVREPATSTPFGHTGYMKYLTLKIIQAMGFKDIAITGLYYKDSYTPETQVLEELQDRGESMEGMVAMFGPGDVDRKAGLAAVKEYRIPNAFLDLTLKASTRFASADFVQSVLDAVGELDQVFSDMGLPSKPWRSDDEINRISGEGEISLNLVDLMEFLDLQPDGTMNAFREATARKAFNAWKNNEAFSRRVVAILTEEGRGCAGYKDYGTLVKWLRQFFPEEEKYRILVHAHGGNGNTQDAASVESVFKGANGVWSALIPQAAQQGHNSSLVFLDNLLSLGNQNVLEDFWLHQAAQCARHCYFLNFNSFQIPDDCPIWGGRPPQLLHTAFSTVSGEEWRKRRGDYYNTWADDAKVAFRQYAKSQLAREVARLRAERSNQGHYRLSPLVSDLEVWRNRLQEAQVLDVRERAGNFHEEVRSLAFALMNANIRANFDEAVTLKELVRIVRARKQQKERFPKVENYEKAKQHQGDNE